MCVCVWLSTFNYILWSLLQKEGVLTTFSPVAKFTSIRLTSTLTTYYGLELHQMYV
jgi:hypothetical protein